MTERDVMEYYHTMSDLLGQLEFRRADIAVRHGIETAPLMRVALAADLTALDEQIAHEKDWLRRAGARFNGSVQISFEIRLALDRGRRARPVRPCS